MGLGHHPRPSRLRPVAVMDLADASLVLLPESLGHGRILTTDQREFRTYRWKSKATVRALARLRSAALLGRNLRVSITCPRRRAIVSFAPRPKFRT
jgi:hypothetical protein